jgi:hypothetical protein
MAKINYQSNPRVKQIFEDLENYREFCVDYGFVFDESKLYDMSNYVFRQFAKYQAGKAVRSNWDSLVKEPT